MAGTWMPFVLRESEGNTLRGSMTSSSMYSVRPYSLMRQPVLVGSYSTDQYRALLPAYVSAIFTYWLDSSYKGFALVTCSGGGLQPGHSTISLVRLGTDKLSALIAAVLLAVSPLLIGKMWNHGVNVAHHSSLVPCFLIALIIFGDRKLGSTHRIVVLTSVLYVASLTYQYQWIIAPCLLSLAVVGRRRWTCIISIVAAVLLFVAMTFLTYQVLVLVGLSVSSLE